MRRIPKLAARLLVVALALALVAPAGASATLTPATAASVGAAMGGMVDLTGTQFSYHMTMPDGDLQIFEGTYLNHHTETVEDLVLRVRKMSAADMSVLEDKYVSATDDYVLAAGDSGTYRLELPMSASYMWEVTGPFAMPSMSEPKRLTVSIESSHVVDGARHYMGTVTNESMSAIPLTDIKVSAEERVGGVFYGEAKDVDLLTKKAVLGSMESTTFDMIGMRPSAQPVTVANLKAQARYKATLSLSASTLAPSYGGSSLLTAVLRPSGSTSVVSSATITARGVSLKAGIASTTTSLVWNGSSNRGYVKPVWATRYAASFAGDSNYSAVSSTSLVVKPKVYLSTPVSPTTQTYGRYYTTYGYLKPRHTAGTYPVRIYKWRLVSGVWRSYGYVKVKVSNYSSYSKYSISMKLPAKGKWRLRATFPTDTYHTGVNTGYRYVTVR